MLSHLDPQKARVLKDAAATLGSIGHNELAERLLDVVQGPRRPAVLADEFIGPLRYAANIQAPATEESPGQHLQIEGLDEDIGPTPFNNPLGLSTGEVDFVESIPPALQPWYDSPFVSLPTGPRHNDSNLRAPINNLGSPDPAPIEYGVQNSSEQYNWIWCQSDSTADGNGQVNAQAHPSHSPDLFPSTSRHLSRVSLFQYGIPQIDNAWDGFGLPARPIPFQEPRMHHQLAPMLPWPNQDPFQAWIVPESLYDSVNPFGNEISSAHGANYAPASFSRGPVPGAPLPTDYLDPLERARRHKRNIKKGLPRAPGLDRVVKRRPFPDNKTKEETNLTRNLKACMRCHLHRTRCFPDKDDPHGVCISCKLANPSFCRLPCIRLKINDIALFRIGSSEDFLRTRRWLGKGLKDISTWETPEARRAQLVQSVGDAPITIEVRKFLPIPGDILTYHWYTPEGEQSLFCPPYALANVQDASKELKRHVEESVASYIKVFTANESRILSSTFTAIQQAISHCQTPAQKSLLQDTLSLWTASRLIENPWRVCKPETLDHDMEDMTHPYWDRTSPYYGHIPVTPVMDSQIDQFVIFLSTFMLLNNYEIATKHDRNFAIRHSLAAPFSNYPLLKDFHAGAKTLLAHFHYCCKGEKPFQKNWNEPAEQKSAQLNDEQKAYMIQLIGLVKEEEGQWPALKESCEYDKGLYFISQLFDPAWEPKNLLV